IYLSKPSGKFFEFGHRDALRLPLLPNGRIKSTSNRLGACRMDSSDFASSNQLQKVGRTLLRILVLSLGTPLALTATSSGPKPPGKLVDLGGHRLHVNCSGRGSPTVIVENGLGDFSFDWILVQSRVSSFT